MLYNAKTLKGYTLDSSDGGIGKVKDFLFDDRHWAIRYLVADTGNWLTGRQVLISPHALAAVDRSENHITIRLTRKQIENSPSLDSDQPVSRQFEEAYHGYYGWPMYWTGPYMWGAYSCPYIQRVDPSADPNPECAKEATHRAAAWDPHLRSAHAVMGYHIHSADGEIGHIEDFIIDDEVWAIRYLIIDTRNWWAGKKVVLAPQWIERVSWSESKVYVNLSREAIKQSPEYAEESLLTRYYETGLHRHYNRQGYWVDEPNKGDFH